MANQIVNNSRKSVNFSIQQDNKTQPPSQQYRKNSIFLTLLFILLFIIFDLILPLYNKSLFAGFGTDGGGFHYPVTTSFIQVFLTSVILLMAVSLNRFIKVKLLGLHDPYFVFSGGLKLFLLKM